MRLWLLMPMVVFGALGVTSLRAEQAGVDRPIYKEIQRDGSALYTDQPSNAAKAKRTDGLGVLGFVSGGSAGPTEAIVPGKKNAPEEVTEEKALEVATTSYSTLRIQTPANSSAVWADQPLVKVKVSIQPLINPEHTLQLRVDPKAWQTVEHDNGAAALPLERGSHRMQARVVDANGGLIRLSAPVKFTVHRASALQ